MPVTKHLLKKWFWNQKTWAVVNLYLIFLPLLKLLRKFFLIKCVTTYTKGTFSGTFSRVLDHHSTETALLKVIDDILMALDNGLAFNCCMLSLIFLINLGCCCFAVKPSWREISSDLLSLTPSSIDDRFGSVFLLLSHVSLLDIDMSRYDDLIQFQNCGQSAKIGIISENQTFRGNPPALPERKIEYLAGLSIKFDGGYKIFAHLINS